MIMSMTSYSVTLPGIYDQANSILSQKLAQVSGVGQVYVGGGANPAVRVELDPNLLNKTGVGLDAVRTALAAANANRPKGEVANPTSAWTVNDNDQIMHADDYRPLIVAYNKSNGAAVRLGDVGAVLVLELPEDVDVLGVIGHGQEIQRLGALDLLALEVDGLALGEPIRLLGGHTAGKHDIGVK